MKRDYYEVLGVDRGVTPEELKKAYRKIALETHPDRRPGDRAAEERFKEASEAYQALSDPERRRNYDLYGHAGGGAVGGAGFPNIEDLFGEVFGDFFGGGGGRRRARRARGEAGSDLRYTLALSLAEVLHGVHREIEVPHARPCAVCRATGLKPGTSPAACPRCGGRGQILFRQGFLTVSQTCDRCGGEGQTIRDPCPECSGKGATRVREKIRVEIPPGVETGMHLKVEGGGDAGIRGGPPGDLYVLLEVEEHPLFRREGQDLLVEVPISYVQAVLGTSLELPTLEGSAVSIEIPSGTQGGAEIKLRGKGLPPLHGGRRGDLRAVVAVEIPTRLSAEERRLLERLSELSGLQAYPRGRSFSEKIRSLFRRS